MEDKRVKKHNDEGIDRLSNLPDAILLHILSFLPTRTCVNTMSLVSRRYRNLWENLQILNVREEDFHNLPINHDELFSSLSFFINEFLTRRKSRHIHKFRLACETYYLDGFSALYADASIRDQPGAFNFPLNIISSCPNLVSLSVRCDIVQQMQLLCSSSAVCFPSLKKLQMRLLNDVDASRVDVVLSSCPILEILEVSLWAKYLKVLGEPHSLKILGVPHSLKSLIIKADKTRVCIFEIDAPCLRFLSLTGVTMGANVIGKLHKVEEAYLDHISLCPLQNLLHALSGIKHLVIDSCSTPAIPKWLFDVEFPEYQHLIHLELIIPCFNINFMYQVLQKCPMLQALIITRQKFPCLLQESLPKLYGWAPKPKTVPNCLVSDLTFIHFKGCQGDLDEMKFTKYVLQKGLFLKTIHISCLSNEKNFMLTQFSNTPRGSASCELKFD